MAMPINFVADGNSSSIAIRNHVGPSTKFEFTVFYYPTSGFGGGTLKMQASPDGGTNWVDIPNSSATSATVVNMEIRATHVRAVLSGATAPDVNVYIL